MDIKKLKEAAEKAGDDEVLELIASHERLREALKAMLEVHGVTQAYADKHIEIPQSWVDVSDAARAALAAAEAA